MQIEPAMIVLEIGPNIQRGKIPPYSLLNTCLLAATHLHCREKRKWAALGRFWKLSYCCLDSE
jgi:hypothetical protein